MPGVRDPGADHTGQRLPRRHLLGATAGLGALLALGPVSASASARAADAGPANEHPLLIVLHLRGGFDGLSAVAPLGDAHFERARPTLAVSRYRAEALTPRWGLHPALAPLLPLWQARELCVVQGVGLPPVSGSGLASGSNFDTGSHFADQQRLDHLLTELGLGSPDSGSADGFAVRHAELGNWDMHHDLGAPGDPRGWFARRASRLAGTIAALPAALGSRWQHTTVLTVTEFGRRVAENGRGGLDHGHASAMFLAGGGLTTGGRVIEQIESLRPGALVEGALPASINLRDILTEVLHNRPLTSATDRSGADYSPETSAGPA